MIFNLQSNPLFFYDSRNYDADYASRIEKCQMEYLDRMPKEKEESFFRFMNYVSDISCRNKSDKGLVTKLKEDVSS